MGSWSLPATGGVSLRGWSDGVRARARSCSPPGVDVCRGGTVEVAAPVGGSSQDRCPRRSAPGPTAASW